MCGNNSCFGGNLWWIIILILLFNCGGIGCGNDCGCGNNNTNGGCGRLLKKKNFSPGPGARGGLR